MEIDEIIKILEDKTSKKNFFEIVEKTFPQAIRIEAPFLRPVCDELYQNSKTYFDLLSCITGIDNGPEENSMDIIYNLYSIPHDHHLMLKVALNRKKPEVDSVSKIWKTANWHEREAYDLLGIHFKGHPDLRRILLPADWEGHPLRRDYKHREYYRGIKVEY